MHKLWCFLLLLFAYQGQSQTCFDAYDLMFEAGADTLSYEEFHQRELTFLNDLEGCSVPDFSVNTYAGEEIILSALQGKVVVLNFWFTACLPCLKEIPELNKLTQKFDTDEVVFIALARDDKAKLEAFFKRFGSFEYQIIPSSHDVATEYKVVGWPQSMVLDKNGAVYRSWAGRHESVEVLVGEIKAAIEECQ